MRNWIPVASVALAISPPRASISRTICPLARPPMAGLHDMRPVASILRVRTRVSWPMRALERAASIPAWPAPTTITSCIARIVPGAARAGKGSGPGRGRLGGIPARHVGPLALHELGQEGFHVPDRDADLLHRVALADRDLVVRGRLLVADGLDVDGDAEGGADFVLASVELADRRGVVINREPAVAQRRHERPGGRHNLLVLLEQR